MSPAIRYSASNSSRITKKILSPYKSTQSKLILPSEAKYLQNIQHEKEKRQKSMNNKQPEKLQELTSKHHILDYEFDSTDDITVAIKTILQTQWDEIPPTARLSKKLRSEISMFRTNVPEVVSVNQLYSIFPSIPTYVDRSLERLSEKGILRRVYVNNSENDLIVFNDYYLSVIDSMVSLSPSKLPDDGETAHIPGSNKALSQVQLQTMGTWRSFVANNTSMYLSTDNIAKLKFGRDDITTLINLGFLTILQDHGETMNYSITLPSIGIFYRLVTTARKWILKILSKQSFNELLEDQIIERWEKNRFKFKEFKGISLNWVLCDGIGSGDLEAFTTPAGRGWKSTSK